MANADPLLARLIEAFAVADCCWFASTRPDGRPHLAPIWHGWHNDTAYVVTKAASVRARNIRANPNVSLSLPDPMNVFIIEGIARFAPQAEAEIAPLFQAKYNWDITTDADYDTIIAVEPLRALAWGSHGEGRWQFDK